MAGSSSNTGRHCTLPGCLRPYQSSRFYRIEEGKRSGGRDWSSLVDSVLCKACYQRFLTRGTTERSQSNFSNLSRKLLPSAASSPQRPSVSKRCTYEHCIKPDVSKMFYHIERGKSAGGRDWSSVVGHVLCHACYMRFRDRGTLERMFQSAAACSPSTGKSSVSERKGEGRHVDLSNHLTASKASTSRADSRPGVVKYPSLLKEAAALTGAKVRQYYEGYGKGEPFETQGIYGMGVLAGTVADVRRERCPRLDEIGLRVVFTIQYEDGDAVDIGLGQLASMTMVGDEAVPVLVEDKLQDTSVVQEVRRAASPVVGLKLDESCVDVVCEYARMLQVQEELAMIGLSVIEPVHSCLEDDEALSESCRMKEESDAGFDSRRDMGARTSGPPPCKRGKVASASPDARLDKARPGSDSCARSPKRCTYEFCERPEESTKFYQIYDFSSAGGQDWSSLVGHTLCEKHYSRFKKWGVLERESQVGRNSEPAPPPLPPPPRRTPPLRKPHASFDLDPVQSPKRFSNGRCMNKDCDRPDHGSAYYSVHKSTRAGGQDWSSLAGFTLCESCYSRFKRRGTLDRALPIKRQCSPSRCTHEECQSPDKGSRFHRIVSGQTSGGQDWSSLVGHVLCDACYVQYKDEGTLQRARKGLVSGSAKRCSYRNCESPCQSGHFHTIGLGRTSGGQDWTQLVGQTLCHSCYLRYENTGNLETTPKGQVGGRRLAAYEKYCTYEHCNRPDKSYHFYPIEEGKTSGGRDWSSLVGNVLCKACYSRFLTKGTLDSTLNVSDSGGKRGKPISHDLSPRRCTNEHCTQPDQSSSFYTIEEGKTSGGRDWSHLSGQVLCHPCYMRYKDRGTLERMLAPRRQHEPEKKMICKQEDHGRLGERRARQRAAGLSTPKPSSRGERTSQGPSVGVASRARSEAEAYNSSNRRDRSDTVNVRPCKKPKTRHDEQGVSSGTAKKVKVEGRGEAGMVGGGKGATSADFVKRCTFEHCDKPHDSYYFYPIHKGKTAGGRNWGPLVGNVLCHSCYMRFKDRGTLERSVFKPASCASSAMSCTNEFCRKPTQSNRFHQIEAGKKSGGQDWSSLVGSVLCYSCYERFKSRGTLEMEDESDTSFSRGCTYERCQRPHAGNKFHRIERGKTSGGRDWSSLVGSLLCHSCHQYFIEEGTLDRGRKK